MHDDLVDRIAILEDELARLKRRVVAEDQTSTRRDVFTKLVVGAGAAAGAVLLEATSDAGVWGNSDSGGVGVYGGGGIGLVGSGTRAGVRIDPVGAAPASRTDAHDRGEIIHDTTGALWFCVASGSPGTWRRVADPGSAGQLRLLTAPARTYDSRTGDGPLRSNSQRSVSVRTGVANNVTVAAAPESSTGALVNLTIDATAGAGYLALFADGVAWPGNSNINWTNSGQTIAGTTVTALAATGRLAVYAGGGGSTDFIIDVIGWYG